MQKKLYIGVDVGGTKMSAGLVDDSGKIFFSLKHQTPQNAKAHEVAAHVIKLIAEILSQKKVQVEHIAGIGIGVPGVVHSNQRDILVTPNINLAGFPLASMIENRFKARTVLGNDVNLGMLGEKWLGAGKEAKDIIGLFLGTGVGGAIIINNRLVTGSKGAAAELGHIVMDMKSKKTSAGLTGTLEALIGRRSVERDLRQAVKAGRKSIITKLTGGNLNLIKSRVLKEALEKKDPLVTEIMMNAAKILGQACVSLNHIFNPEMFILGGGVIEACGKFLVPIVKEEIKNDPFFAGLDNCRVCVSELGDDAVILGAVVVARQALGEKVFFKEPSYPFLKYVRGKGVMVGSDLVKTSFLILANGRIKVIPTRRTGHKWDVPRSIKLAYIQKIIKKQPNTLIHGYTAKKRFALSKEGLEYLKQVGVTYKPMPLARALTYYPTVKGRKAILVEQR